MKRTFDANMVHYLFTSDPETYSLSSDDGCPDINDFDAAPTVARTHECYFIVASNGREVMGLFFFRKRNHILADVHVAILKEHRGKHAVTAARMAFSWIFENGFKKIQAYIPSFNKMAYHFAKMAGMRDEGRSIKSFMKCGILHDQFILGVSGG